jgi:hypothetical protein
MPIVIKIHDVIARKESRYAGRLTKQSVCYEAQSSFTITNSASNQQNFVVSRLLCHTPAKRRRYSSQ